MKSKMNARNVLVFPEYNFFPFWPKFSTDLGLVCLSTSLRYYAFHSLKSFLFKDTGSKSRVRVGFQSLEIDSPGLKLENRFQVDSLVGGVL